jgi:hydroxylysine kinase
VNDLPSPDALCDAQPDNDPMTTQVAPLSMDQALELVRSRFGIDATSARALDSEKDQNFRIEAADGRRFVLKITNPAEDRRVTNLQTQAIQHVAARPSPGALVPTVFAAVDGSVEPICEIGDRPPQVVRLLSYLAGTPLGDATPSPEQRQALGRAIAAIGLALADFRHPAAAHQMPWDLQHAEQVRVHLDHVPDADRRRQAEHALDRLRDQLEPRRGRLRRQVVHADLNPKNVLVDPQDHRRIAGVIDFGDCVETHLVFDLAVACAYHVAGAPQPLDHAAEITRAYHGVSPLLPEEVNLLPDLIAARLVMGVLINGWRAALQPANAPYILANSARAWEGIARLAAVGPTAAANVFARATGLE